MAEVKLGWQSVGGGGRIQRPREFVISRVMLFNGLSPVAGGYLRLREIPRAALTPCRELSGSVSQGPASRRPLNF